VSRVIRVNTAYAIAVFYNVGGLTDLDNVKPELCGWDLRHVDNERLHRLVDKYVVPDLKAFRPEQLARAKLAIQHLLTFTPEAAERVLPSLLAGIPTPGPAHLLFQWVWGEVFPGESWALDRSVEYEAFYDPNESASHLTRDDAKIPSPLIGEEFR
jgi:hypothetical protein